MDQSQQNLCRGQFEMSRPSTSNGSEQLLGDRVHTVAAYLASVITTGSSNSDISGTHPELLYFEDIRHVLLRSSHTQRVCRELTYHFHLQNP